MTTQRNSPTRAGYTISRRGRYWELLDPDGELVCLTVYRLGAEEVVRRLGGTLPSNGIAAAGQAG